MNQKVHLFNQTIKNIPCNFKPHETVTCDDRDPPWINSKIKGLIQEKNIAKKCFFQNNKDIQLFRRFQCIQNLLTATIEKSKEQFYSRISTKLMDPTISPKAYWSILKTFLNNKKIPCIPPNYHNNNYITDFKEKTQIFNDFFAKQCTLVENSSKLPTNSFKRTNNLLSTISFTKDDIAKIIKNLNPNKAHGFDMISIRMIKICGELILKPLEHIFKSCLENGKFPNEWKKANVVPVHKRNNKQLIENYRPVSLLPVCGKILERLIYNKMFEFFTENELISQNQSGFKPGDSCISQLLCITHDIYQSPDDGLETRAVFLDISKAFDKVWHEGLLFKLKLNGISGNLLNVITDFLYQIKQKVVLNGQHSSWTNVQAGVPQGSILSPLFFLIYINDLSDGLNSNPKLFADDTSLFSVVQNINSTANALNSDLIKNK